MPFWLAINKVEIIDILRERQEKNMSVDTGANTLPYPSADEYLGENCFRMKKL
jgi:hypothetical protein